MILKKQLSKLYWWGLKTFIFNDLIQKIFFSKGYPKRINGTIIKMPFKYRWVYPNSYEVEKTNFITSHCSPGDTVIDIGAHMGVFTYFLANQVGQNGKVYSFEPTPLAYSLLKKNIIYNKLDKIVEASPAAVADKEGEITFYLNDALSKGNSISSNNTVAKNVQIQHDEVIKVKTISLDSLLGKEKIENLKLIKIDAEGAELQILKGGKELIQKYKPFITLEIHPFSFDDIEKIMTELYNTISAYNYIILEGDRELTITDFKDHNTFFEVVLVPR